MSRNFEPLSQAGSMEELLQTQNELLQPQMEQPLGAAPGPLLVENAFPSAPLLVVNGVVRDEIGKLVQNLFLGPQGSMRVVFSGTEPGCGSTWTCAHAADGLAQTRGSVCVVDCNLRSPGLHRQFGTENHRGLSDALLGFAPIREYVHRLSRNLWLLSCGSAAEAGQEMIASDRMRSRLAELVGAFDYVLIDAAPLNTTNDAIVLGGLSDGVVLVLKSHSSRREAARKAVQELQVAKVRTLGAVLNQRTFPVPERLYKRL